jgi:hypothetical protein
MKVVSVWYLVFSYWQANKLTLLHICYTKHETRITKHQTLLGG